MLEISTPLIASVAVVAVVAVVAAVVAVAAVAVCIALERDYQRILKRSREARAAERLELQLWIDEFEQRRHLSGRASD